MDARYYGQTPYMNLKLESAPAEQAEVDALVAQYRERYEAEFGYQLPEDVATVEIVNARVGGDRPDRRRRAAPRRGASTARRGAQVGERPVYFDETGDFTDTPIYDRAKLGAGAEISGPAVIEQTDTTVLVPPEAPRRGRTSYLNIVIDVRPAGRAPRRRGAAGHRREGRLSMETATHRAPATSALRNDPITFEVLRNAFKSICNEASALIERVSYAPTITEGHDYSVSILTPDGRLVSHGQRDQAPHMGTFESSVQNLVQGGRRVRPGRRLHLQRPLHRRHPPERRQDHPPDLLGGRAVRLRDRPLPLARRRRADARDLQPARDRVLRGGPADAAAEAV